MSECSCTTIGETQMPQVKIRIERGQDQAGDANTNQKVNADEKKQIAATSVFAHQMMGLGKQIFNYATSNVGFFTGNYIKQDEINATLDVISDVSTVGMGFVSGGWVGGIVATLGIATKKTLQAVTDRRNDIVQERERNYWLSRSGNSTTNGSRGTEN